MTEPTATAQPSSLLSRIIGVITSPKATFEKIVAVPRPVGVLAVVAFLVAASQQAPQFTEAGRHFALDQQVKFAEKIFGKTTTPEEYAKMDETAQKPVVRLVGFAAAFLFMPIFPLFLAAIYWAVFNTIMGGTATFKQVLAIVTHSAIITALGMALAVPIQLAKSAFSLTGPFTLGALAPNMAEPGTTLAGFLNGIDIFRIWGICVTAIGLAVLYRRKSTNIAIALMVIYFLFVLLMATIAPSIMSPTT